MPPVDCGRRFPAAEEYLSYTIINIQYRGNPPRAARQHGPPFGHHGLHFAEAPGVQRAPQLRVPPARSLEAGGVDSRWEIGTIQGVAAGILISTLFLLIMVFLMTLIWTGSRGAPWVPTPRSTVRRMLELARVRQGELVYDLGSGDGRVLVTAARRFGARAVGIELDPSRYLWSRAAVWLLGLNGRVRVVRADLFGQDLRAADVVVTYLLQETNDRLKDKLRRELRPGARIVSNTFTFSGLPLVAVDEALGLYVYRMGARDRPDPLAPAAD